MRHRWTMLLIVAWLAAPTITQAQEEPQADQQRNRARRHQPPNRQQALIDRLRAQLDLDDEQLAKFDRLAEEFGKTRRSGPRPDEERRLLEDLHSARQAGDEERVAQIRRELEQLRGPNPALAFLDKVAGILREDQREKLARIREQVAARGSPDRGRPLAQLQRLRDELKLDEEQAALYDELYADLQTKLEQGRTGGGDAESEFLEKLREAVDSGDEEAIKELRNQRPDPQERTEGAVAEFLEKVESILDPEQAQTLRRFQDRMRSRAGRGRPDLRACFRFVARLDLNREQRESLKDLKEEALRAEREARRNPEELEHVTAEVHRELRELLTDEQVAKFDKWLEEQKRDRRGRGPRGDRPRRDRRAETEKP